MSTKHYEVLIVGGGVSGAALFYELERYTDIKSICLLEKYERLASLNSNSSANSQTLHCGDIETNYTLEKARKVKKTAKMVELYALQHGYENSIIFSHQKMVLGVGHEEIRFLKNRHEEFKELYPYMEIFDKEQLKKIEPAVVYDADGRERADDIIAIGAQGQYTTVDFGRLTKSFIDNALNSSATETDIFFNSKVVQIKKVDGVFRVKTEDGEYSADSVIVNAGAHSLFIAHRMGYGLDMGILPMAGSFYRSTKHILEGKVYMVQNPKLPFAALHGDPDLLLDGMTRFGPTALVLPKLERYRSGTFIDFIRTLRFDFNIVKIFYDLLKDSDIRNYVFRNFLFEISWINKRLFAKDARKIIPSLQVEDIEYAKGFGGVRPQVLDKKEQKLLLGEASIRTDDGIVFNMTPSPGATSCLGNALRDVEYICNYLNKSFDRELFERELTEQEERR